MEKPNYYSVIPANVRYDKKLSANAKILYGEITALCNEKGISWASNEYFANLYGVSKSTITRWISELVNEKYIFTKMFYKKNSKEIEKRIISVNHFNKNAPISKNDNTYTQNCVDNVYAKKDIGYMQNCGYPTRKNEEENITSINKKNKKKEEQEKLKRIIDFYENNIATITQYVSEDMEKYLQEGVQEDLIIVCMKEAVSRNKRFWKYVASILNNCLNNKITTAKQFKISQDEFKTNKGQITKKEKPKEKEEYEELYFDNEQEYRKKLFEKQKG